MWQLRRLTTLWASTACYRDRFTFLLLYVLYIIAVPIHLEDILRRCQYQGCIPLDYRNTEELERIRIEMAVAYSSTNTAFAWRN
jgi:hypothetical protein